jgi:hypothetical protein
MMTGRLVWMTDCIALAGPPGNMVIVITADV